MARVFHDGKCLCKHTFKPGGLDVWRVTEVGKKNETKAERQYDAIAKSILLFSLFDSVFNRVFANENAHKLWKQIVENHEGQRMLLIKNIMFSARS